MHFAARRYANTNVSCDFMEPPILIEALNDDVFRILDKGYFLNQLDEKAVKARWMGFGPASLQSIARKESELRTTLPPSYKDFLLVSNGFRHISMFIYKLYSVEEIDWAANVEDERWLAGIESDPIEVSDHDYSDYSENQRPERFRPEYFRNSLKISGWGDACCLFLNPNIQHKGEWEVLFYATWLPGTNRYRSFKDYLIQTHEHNLNAIRAED